MTGRMTDHGLNKTSRWMCYDGWYDRYFFSNKKDMLKKAYSLIKKFPYPEDPIVYVYSVKKGSLAYTSEGRVVKRLDRNGEIIVFIPRYGKSRIVMPSGVFREEKPAPFGL